MELVYNPLSILALIIFIASYVLVIFEEKLHLAKSKPVILGSGLIWILVALVAKQNTNLSHEYMHVITHGLEEYAELFLFLLVAMTYVNAMEERGLFQALRVKILNFGLSLKAVFWLSGFMAFFLSPLIDNLTTALLLGAVVMSIGKGNSKFILLSCINIVVAANAGGAFSPFGDITTLMVWQKGFVAFNEFFYLIIPSLVNFIVPAFILSYFVPKEQPEVSEETINLKPGAYVIVGLFALTILTTVMVHNVLHIPPVIGMMLGLGYLGFFDFYLKKKRFRTLKATKNQIDIGDFDIFKKIQRAEWDTLLFFYGVMLSVAGLGALGYLSLVANGLYGTLGQGLPVWLQAAPANVLIGILSAIVDNIPVMYAVLTMSPDMSLGQWLLVTLTAGVGGSLLSIGSAAGVALMGQARGNYSFFGHLKWSWAIMLGYILSIATHIIINKSLFLM